MCRSPRNTVGRRSPSAWEHWRGSPRNASSGSSGRRCEDRRHRGCPPDRRSAWVDALSWAVATGFGVGVARLLAVRTAAAVWEAAVHEQLPEPGLVESTSGIATSTPSRSGLRRGLLLFLGARSLAGAVVRVLVAAFFFAVFLVVVALGWAEPCCVRAPTAAVTTSTVPSACPPNSTTRSSLSATPLPIGASLFKSRPLCDRLWRESDSATSLASSTTTSTTLAIKPFTAPGCRCRSMAIVPHRTPIRINETTQKTPNAKPTTPITMARLRTASCPMPLLRAPACAPSSARGISRGLKSRDPRRLSEASPDKRFGRQLRFGILCLKPQNILLPLGTLMGRVLIFLVSPPRMAGARAEHMRT